MFSELFRDAKEALKSGNVCIDCCNISHKDRKNTINRFSDLDHYTTAVVIDTNISEVYSRNSSRSRVVPEDVINRFNKKFILPTFEEGFDTIKIVTGDLEYDTKRST